MSLDFCCDIQMVGSEFDVKNMKAWIHPASSQRIRLEIDRYIGLPIFFPIFKHFTIIGYRLKKNKKKKHFFLFVTYTIIQSITSSEICSLYLTHPSAHTPGAVDKHTHTWSSGHSEKLQHGHRIQDSLVWNTLNYINIYYRTIISPINISIKINYLFSPQAITVWV